MVYYNNYTTPQTYSNYNNYNQYQNWSNDNNGWTAMNYTNQWYPGWWAYSYRWDQNSHCWKIYLHHGNQYKTVWMNYNYSWMGDRDGNWW